MELRLIREPSIQGATLGSLYVDGRWQCWMLEDQIREIPGLPVREWKVPGHTAIPAGRYQITITESVRFRRPLPLLIGVPGFAGIRIHPGNRKSDTEGCLLPGLLRDESASGAHAPQVKESRIAFNALYDKLDAVQTAGQEPIWITIENPWRAARAA